MKFKIGDVVVLKSGGPDMTVDGHDDDGKVICLWFEGVKTHMQRFSEGSLLEVPEEYDVSR